MSDNNLMKSKAAPQSVPQSPRSTDANETGAHDLGSDLRAELDEVCRWLESLDAVASGSFEWNDGNTSLSAVKEAPMHQKKGSTAGLKGSK